MSLGRGGGGETHAVTGRTQTGRPGANSGPGGSGSTSSAREGRGGGGVGKGVPAGVEVLNLRLGKHFWKDTTPGLPYPGPFSPRPHLEG